MPKIQDNENFSLQDNGNFSLLKLNPVIVNGLLGVGGRLEQESSTFFHDGPN